MFTVRWTPTARRRFDELQAAARKTAEKRGRSGKSKSSRQEGLFQQVRKTILLLTADPRHPGLQTHPYHSLPNPFDPSAKAFEAHAQNRTPGAYLVFWCYGPGKNQITLIAITPHP